MTSLIMPFARHPFLALMMFMAGYFVTISVRADAHTVPSHAPHYQQAHLR